MGLLTHSTDRFAIGLTVRRTRRGEPYGDAGKIHDIVYPQHAIVHFPTESKTEKHKLTRLVPTK